MEASLIFTNGGGAIHIKCQTRNIIDIQSEHTDHKTLIAYNLRIVVSSKIA